MKTYFVYQNWTSEKLYAQGLTQAEAYELQKDLDNLISSGGFGNGCACIGDTSDESDKHVAKRLGLI